MPPRPGRSLLRFEWNCHYKIRRDMELALQFGYGMMEHARTLVRKWGEGTVILSPRDLNENQLAPLSGAIRSSGGQILLDPQCYVRDTSHPRLITHAHWDAFARTDSSALFSPAGARPLISELVRLAAELSPKAILLPGLLTGTIDDQWNDLHENFAQVAKSLSEQPLYATIALEEAAILSEDQVEDAVSYLSSWPVDGVYLVAEAPGDSYLVEHPGWLANILILISGLRLQGKEVILGYSSQQLLCAAVAGLSELASGTWQNLRGFTRQRYYARDENQVSRRARWYYGPDTLSEYKIPFLDIAQRSGVLSQLRPKPPLPAEFSNPLFSGAAPSAVGWGDQNAFRHYLDVLHAQAGAATATTYAKCYQNHVAILDQAQSELGSLRASGVIPGRSISGCLDANRSALTLLHQARGSQLAASWPL
jgi:hypothetical protein